MPKYFQFAFGVDGNRAAVPETTQPSGAVSYQEGFGPDYERELGVDPLAKPVPRDESNQLYFDITENIQQYQQFGTPNFITAVDNGGVAFPYSKWARVRYDDGTSVDVYTSLVDTNTSLPTDATKWRKGDQVGITSLSGDVVATGPGAAVATIQVNAITTPKIAAQAVTLDKMEFRAANTVLGNATNAPGQVQEIALPQSSILGRGQTGNIAPITVGTGLSLTGTVLSNPGAPIAANSILANATNGSAVPTAVALSAQKRLVGRGATGSIAQISLGDSLDMAGAVLDVTLAQSRTTSGYVRLPGGVILQWGVRALGGSGNISFPIPFPVACRSVQLTPIFNSVGVTSPVTVTFLDDAPTVNGFQIRLYAGVNTPRDNAVYWFAIGY